MCYLICCTQVLLFFTRIPEQIDAFVPFLHEFKNSDIVEIGLLHSQPFPLPHYYGIGELPDTASVLT